MDLPQQPFRRQLEDRRGRLTRAISEVGEAPDLVRLLREVDSALRRIDGNAYGRCEVCRDSVEPGFLEQNPLIQYCLCDLSPLQQSALQQDLDLAARIQWALLPPQDLSFAGWETHFRYEPLRAVSGDYCDLVARDGADGGLYFLVGDVSGKGVAAAFVMAHLNAMFRSLIDARPSVGELVERANRLLIENRIASHYATLVCGRAAGNGRVELCNAGHCPPLLLRGSRVEAVQASGLPIGLFGGRSYTTSQLVLEGGETLLLYTDGLTETTDALGREYGAERLALLLRQGTARSPRSLAAACLADVGKFAAGSARTDDLAVLVLRRAASGGYGGSTQ